LLPDDIESISGNKKPNSKQNIIKNRENRHNISFGLFDSRIGGSFISYNYDILQNKKLNNEFFIGLGTAIISTNISCGYKQYYTTGKRSIFSVISMHLSAITINPDWSQPNQIGFHPTIALGLERVFNKLSIQYGLFSLAMKVKYTENEIDYTRYEYGALPFINIDYRF